MHPSLTISGTKIEFEIIKIIKNPHTLPHLWYDTMMLQLRLVSQIMNHDPAS